MRHAEILAPVGGREQLLAAVRCGADAVYLGGKGFNARQNAENFDALGLPEAVALCHGRGVKVYVTLNTLFTDPETQALVEQIKEIALTGADAVIVQDMGTAALVRRICPTLHLHASTQMSVTSVAGAKLLEEQGFTRVVLARELGREEIAAICAATSMEVEVFVHGALCMSVSGQCYLSSVLGERSGNRGLCAQPCRLDFKSHGREYALSLKDLTLVDQLEGLTAAGVTSLKIEGRMKRPEYVAAAVTACRQALDGETPDLDTLQKVFSRSGFTNGYYTNRRDLTMFGYRRKEDVTAAAGVLGALAATYRGELARVPVDMALTMHRDQPVELQVTDGEYTVIKAGDAPQIAQNRPTDEAMARRSLEKTGGTPFVLRNLTVDLAPGLMQPMSVLNQLRKGALEELLAYRETVVPHKVQLPDNMVHHPKLTVLRQPALRGRFENAEQLSDQILQHLDAVILPVEELVKRPQLIEQLGDKLIGEAPLLVFPAREEAFLTSLKQLKEKGLKRLLAGNLATVKLGFEAGLAVLGDTGLNVINSHALAAFRNLGLEDMTLSFECNLKLAATMGDYLPYGVLGYGYLPLMTFRNCPAKVAAGCGGCQGVGSLTDRKGNDFTVKCRGREYSHLLNMVPLYLGDRQDSIRGASFVTLRFTTENAPGCLRVVQSWLEGAPLGSPRTAGLSFRELK